MRQGGNGKRGGALRVAMLAVLGVAAALGAECTIRASNLPGYIDVVPNDGSGVVSYAAEALVSIRFAAEDPTGPRCELTFTTGYAQPYVVRIPDTPTNRESIERIVLAARRAAFSAPPSH